MSLDLVKAIKAPFSGQDWIKKLIIGGILFIIPIVNFAMVGYVIKYLKKLGYNPRTDYYGNVNYWKEWFENDVKKFHKYHDQNGEEKEMEIQVPTEEKYMFAYFDGWVRD